MRIRLLAVIFLLCGQSTAFAGGPATPITTFSESEETIFSIGLRFSFGDMAPELVGAVRSTTTDTGSDVRGIQGDVALPLTGDNVGKVKVRVLGLLGNRDILGQAGVGYNFGSSQPLFAAGLQGSNGEGGVNIELDGEFDPYIGVNLFGRPAGPNSSTPLSK